MNAEPRRLIHGVYDAAFRTFRPARLRLFFQALAIGSETRVVDIGGMPYFWQLASQLGLPAPRVTIVNLLPPSGELPSNVAWIRGDGRALPFRDMAFDAAFCNSVIEHVAEQPAMAREIARVAARYFVQTPSRRFPIEQHLVTVGLHWLPVRQQKRWMRFSLARINGRLPLAVMERFLDDLHLLDRRGLAALFPDAEIRVERFLGMEKSLLAIR